VLDSEDADGVWVSVSVSVSAVFAVSTGVVVTGVVAVSELVVASAGVACSVVVAWVWAGSASVVCVVEVDDAACGDCDAASRAFVELVEVVDRFFAAAEDPPFASAPFVAAFAVRPGKACAASNVKAPVSVAEPASSQRLQRPRRRRAASRELLDVGVVMDTYSPP
jgi:hypothetical protein